MLLWCGSCIYEPWAITTKSVALIVTHDDDTTLFCGLDESQTRKDFSYGTARASMDTNDDTGRGKINPGCVQECLQDKSLWVLGLIKIVLNQMEQPSWMEAALSGHH